MRYIFPIAIIIINICYNISLTDNKVDSRKITCTLMFIASDLLKIRVNGKNKQIYILYIFIKSHISIRSLYFLFFFIFHQLAVNRQGVPTASCTTNGLGPVWNKFVTPDTRTANSWTLATQVSQLYPLIGYIT